MFIFWNTYRKIRERGFEMSRRKKKRRRKSFFGQFIKIVFSMVLREQVFLLIPKYQITAVMI